MQRTLTTRRFLSALAIVVLVTAVSGAWITLSIGGAAVTLWVDDLVTPLAAGIACVLCLRARARHAGRMRRFWLLLGCAMASWTLAELVWGYYALILEVEVPVPSWADVGYLSAIPLAVAALVVHPAITGGRTRHARSVFDGLVLATALLLLSWTLVLGPLWRSTDLGTWGGVVAIAYPFGDVIMVFFIVLVIRGMTGGDRLSLWCLLAALLVMALSDSTYTYLTEVANYTAGDPIDTGWIAAYLGIALAAYCSRPEGASVSEVEYAGPSLSSLVAPILPVLIALGVIALEIRLGHQLDRAAWLMAFALIACVLARQGLMAVELLAPRRETQADLLQRLRRVAVGDTGVTEGSRSGVRAGEL
jgi:diguanylate cyclase